MLALANSPMLRFAPNDNNFWRDGHDPRVSSEVGDIERHDVCDTGQFHHADQSRIIHGQALNLVSNEQVPLAIAGIR